MDGPRLGTAWVAASLLLTAPPAFSIDYTYELNRPIEVGYGCPRGDGTPCGSRAESDLDGNLPIIGFPDPAFLRGLMRAPPGPKCDMCLIENLR